MHSIEYFIKEGYELSEGSVVAEIDGVPSELDASDCVDRLNAYKEFITSSPALSTLKREVDVPDRHTIRTLIEEMQEIISSGQNASPAHLGFWVGELLGITEFE
jgi:hypothetical protein